MSNRLHQDREAELQPKRFHFAIEKITALGFEITVIDKTKLQFQFKGETVNLYPYSGWHTGKSIQDGRGIDKLLKQLTR